MFLTAWPWFMDLGSMVFLSLVLVLAFRLIVLIFILTVAASFRVFNSRVAFAAFVLYVFSIIICFTPTERLQASRRTLMRYHNFCGFIMYREVPYASFFYVSFWFAPFFSAWCFKCSSFEFFDWLEVCYARWNSAVVFL